MTKDKVIIIIIAVIPLLIAQAAWIFLDARKRKERGYWLWGLFGLMNCPQSLIIYLIVTRIILKPKGTKRDGSL
jgi:hypothetical protein